MKRVPSIEVVLFVFMLIALVLTIALTHLLIQAQFPVLKKQDRMIVDRMVVGSHGHYSTKV